MSKKTTKFFSKPLMIQNIKSNWVLTLVIVAVMCMMCAVSTYSTSVMVSNKNNEEVTEAQADFYSYLYVMASYNEMAGTDLSYDDFTSAEDKTVYEAAFQAANQQSQGQELTVEGLKKAASFLEDSEVSLDTYIHQFEYVYALGNVKGCFTESDLSVDDMMNTMLTAMGIQPDMLETLENMDTTALFNQMDYTVMGLLPIFLFVVIIGNSLIVNQVDRGSMAYVLSTPTKRSAVTTTQTIFMVVVPLIMVAVTCGVRLISSHIFLDSYNTKEIIVLYLGMYILVEAVAGICYLGSCIFNQSRKAMAFGGGLTVWFFIASILGMFGNENMVKMGFGADALNVFNKMTLVGLFDVNAISTIGSGSLDNSYIWKMGVLAVIAVGCYVAGGTIFKKKDLPL